MAKQRSHEKLFSRALTSFSPSPRKRINFIRDRARYFHVRRDVLGAAALVYLGATTYLNYVNKKGQGAYYAAYSEVRQEKADLEKAEALFKKVGGSYSLSRVSKTRGAADRVLEIPENRHDEAVRFYETFMNNSAENSPYRSLAALALAAVYEEKGEIEKAIMVLRDLSSALKMYSWSKPFWVWAGCIAYRGRKTKPEKFTRSSAAVSRLPRSWRR
jgi:tetratricopeptide (TPR) repeat protein